MAASLSLLVPELRGPARDLIDAASAAGLQPRLTSTLRSHSEQARLYRRFLSGQQGYPVAPPGFSSHEYGLAFDMVVSPMSALADVGYTWQTWGGGWNPGDAVHFELPGASEQAKQLAQNLGQDVMSKGANFAGSIVEPLTYSLAVALAPQGWKKYFPEPGDLIIAVARLYGLPTPNP